MSIEPGFFATDIDRNARARKVHRSGATAERDAYADDEAWLATFFEKGGGRRGRSCRGGRRHGQRGLRSGHPCPQRWSGEDAASLVTLARDVGSLEEWLPAAVSVASMVAGPRPPR